ncbi:uncharacterized protein APUU_70592A [Aspergillus puulaauensis]|uniref:Uncharacterized protein n=1 Tax=Aspergillus puulaauensis TaxID=1220207 RepID=A0A7R8ASD2_9EURO|nr:uncharacterized protein APUU_70592A [Aspergillus puulaauensis]BCS29022.1 hypothetical protein APUU_70592A [Aspergillus puulaauensis]
MAETSNERLNRLQEADLGTARREYISTVDRGFNNMRVQAIEASRKSNVQGSKEQRVAEANKSRLEGWANVHKKIGDTADLEDLDHLLNGQSHRLRLDSMIRGGSVQQFGHTSQVNSSRSVSAAAAGPRAAPLNQRPTRASSMAMKSLPNPPGNCSGLDPALNRNNPSSNTAVWKKKPAGRSASSAQNAPLTRIRRPLNFPPRAISSPEDFLAVARMVTANQRAGKPPTEIPKAQGPADAEVHRKGDLSLTPETPSKPNHQKSPIGGVPLSQKVTSQRAVSPTPVNEVESSDNSLSSDSTNLDSPEETSQVPPVGTTDQAKEEGRLDTRLQDSSANQTLVQAQRPQKAVGMLLDLSFATSIESGPEPGMSPALEELKGLEFTKSLEAKDPPFTLAGVNRKLDFGGVLPKEQKSNELSDIEATTDLEDDEETAAEYQREIDLICDLLAGSFSDTFLSKMTECKKELETRLELGRTPKLRTTARSEKFFTPPTIPESKELGAAVSVAAEVTPTHSRKTSEARITTPTSQSRLNAAAPKFMPKAFTEYRSLSNATTDSSTSFQPTPTKAITEPQSDCASSELTIVPAKADKPPVGTRAESISPEFPTTIQRASSGTLLGDHLLPGASTRKAEQPHLFGDHLLPGRRVFPSLFVPSSTVPVSGPTLAQAAAPDFGPITFSSTSVPRPLKIVDPNAQVASKPAPAKGSSLTPDAPHFEPLNKAASIKTSNAPTPSTTANVAVKTARKTTSMMESIYAPKPKADSSSTGPKKLPVGQGLSASRYSDPKWI